MKKFLFLLFFAFAASNVSAKVMSVFCFSADEKSSVYENNAVRIFIDAGSLRITNKTDDILYVDKGNSFQSLNGNPVCLYTNASYTEGSSRGRGASVNVGSIANALGVGGGIGSALNGVTVGGGTSNLNSTTVYERRVIALHPHTTYTLHSWGWFELQDLIIDRLGNGKTIRPRRAGQVWNFAHSDSPIQFEALVSYAQKEDFSDVRKVMVSNYISCVRTAKKNGTVASLHEPDLRDNDYFSFVEGFPTGLKLLPIGCFAGMIAALCI